MMVYASMATSSILTCGNGSNSSPNGTACDIRQASLPGLNLSTLHRASNLAVTHDRRLSYSALDLSDSERCCNHEQQQQLTRRPSFPQTAGEWGSRHKALTDGRKHRGRRKAISACFLPESDEDISDGHSRGRIPMHLRTCPLYSSGVLTNQKQGVDETTTDSIEKSFPDKHLTAYSQFHPSNLTTLKCSCNISRFEKIRKDDGVEELSNEKFKRSGREHQRNKTSKGQSRNKRETVIINVGGQMFETYRTTLNRLRTPIFHSEDKLELYYRKSHDDYFFDRDPIAFGSVLNFLRTGELHIPTNMCGPALQNELDFWGIQEVDIARCCWTQYNTWKTQCRSLEKLEYDRKFSTTQEITQVDPDSSCWTQYSSKIWTFLQDPGSSKKAKVYAWVSIIFVFFSIFSFCAETHPMFKVNATEVIRLASLYKFFYIHSDLWVDAVPQDSLTHSNASILNSGTRNITETRISKVIKRSSKAHCHHACCLSAGAVDDDGGDNGRENDNLPHPALLVMDVTCLFFFSLEYLTRFLCSPSKLNFLRALQNIVDFLAFAPDYIELIFRIISPHQTEGVAIMEMLFILRILRLFRIFRLIRHVPGLWILLYTLKASFNELMLMCVFLLIGMVVFATLVHFVEPDGTFNNIPVGFWWSVVTMTTVGYGDMYPTSAAGYIIGSCCAVAGLLMIAFTVPIIVSNFVLYYTHVQYGLARRDRELERMKDEEQSEIGGSRSRLNIDKVGSLTSLTASRKLKQVAATTRNGKSYTPISSSGDVMYQSVNTSEVGVTEMEFREKTV